MLFLRASPTLLSIIAVSLLSPALAQTFSKCNPTQGQCPADPALGKSVNIDFTSGASSEFDSVGNPTYDSNGASFTVAKSGDAPTLSSKWYIMFGKYEVTMKAAPGVGIVSSVVMQSDDLDEIDWEWLGASDNNVQSNYFGKGQTTTYDRSAVHAVSDTQGQFHTYSVEWTSTQIVWQIDGTTVRVLSAASANGQFPQSPMQLKIGAWSGGDPSNAAGTIQWAGGSTNYANGPYTMVVKSVSVSDYSTGTSYSYGDTSGAWTSIHAAGGSVNGGASGVQAASPAITSTSSGDVVPFGGTHRSSSVTSIPNAGGWQATTMTTSAAVNTNLPGLPAGWTVSGSGKVVPPSAAPSTSQLISSTSSPAPSVSASCAAAGSGSEIVTTYNQQGFLTTMLVANANGPKSFDDHGFLVTAAPAACTAVANAGSGAVMAANGEVGALKDTLASSSVAGTGAVPTLTSGGAAGSKVGMGMVGMGLVAAVGFW